MATEGSPLHARNLYVTGDPEADKLLNTEPLAALLGMLLNQHMR